MMDYKKDNYTINEETEAQDDDDSFFYRNQAPQPHNDIYSDSHSDSDSDDVNDFEGALNPAQIEGGSFYIEGSYSNFDLT